MPQPNPPVCLRVFQQSPYEYCGGWWNKSHLGDCKIKRTRIGLHLLPTQNMTVLTAASSSAFPLSAEEILSTSPISERVVTATSRVSAATSAVACTPSMLIAARFSATSITALTFMSKFANGFSTSFPSPTSPFCDPFVTLLVGSSFKPFTAPFVITFVNASLLRTTPLSFSITHATLLVHTFSKIMNTWVMRTALERLWKMN